MRRAALFAVLAGAAVSAGCNILAFPLYALAPEPPAETVKAEFDGLRDKTVAVVVYADMGVLFEHPYVREELGAAVNAELGEHIAGARTVDALRVVRYLQSNAHWESMPLPELGRALGADYVLYLSLNQFTTRGPGSMYPRGGRISAAASVHDTRPMLAGMDPCRWRKDNLVTETGGSVMGSAAAGQALRVQMTRSFAAKLVQCFYDHTVPHESQARPRAG